MGITLKHFLCETDQVLSAEKYKNINYIFDVFDINIDIILSQVSYKEDIVHLFFYSWLGKNESEFDSGGIIFI